MKKIKPHTSRLLAPIKALIKLILVVSIAGLAVDAYSDQSAAKNKAEAAKIAQKRHGGKVLKVSTETKDDKTYYKVKLVLDNGRVKTTKIAGEK